ncbi:MAG: FmdE family protein [Methanosarcinales archaeon]|nr:FmdE family protein [ANME-2 cluster archaeon]MDF1531273.1 FmdE family protein [ANME-2 cluster archaeon]MDW7776131.1 FmdE family protein [Methanosarcinales archaeon]
MNDKEIIELAVKLHGHLAPGLALGLRMSEIALERLAVERGHKRIMGISETARCLADAMQAATGCTMGHGNAFVEDYGKLALTISNTETNNGIRVALKQDAQDLSPLMKTWMMRLGRLSHEQEDELGAELLVMDEKYLDIQEVLVDMGQNFESTRIVECFECKDLVPSGLTGVIDDKVVCKVCSGQGYYRVT